MSTFEFDKTSVKTELTVTEGSRGIDLQKLSQLESPEIEAIGLAAARSTPPDYELLTDAWLEFKRRLSRRKRIRHG